jgi:hypothetical protein
MESGQIAAIHQWEVDSGEMKPKENQTLFLIFFLAG